MQILLHEFPDILTLVPQGGTDNEHSAKADGALGGLNAVADFR